METNMTIAYAKPMPSQSRLKQLFDYIPATGELIRKTPRYKNSAGTVQFSAKVDGVRFEKHRLIWVWANGPIPKGYIVDHINRDDRDDRLINLRCVTWSKNVRNTSGHRSRHGLPRNVSKTRNGKYAVAIRVGTFDTVQEAATAAARAIQLIHP
jgi:HNH endonuclease